MTILFFCLGGALALTSLTALDLYEENKELKKQYNDTFEKGLKELDKKEE